MLHFHHVALSLVSNVGLQHQQFTRTTVQNEIQTKTVWIWFIDLIVSSLPVDEVGSWEFAGLKSLLLGIQLWIVAFLFVSNCYRFYIAFFNLR